jgi:hypothetical protein
MIRVDKNRDMAAYEAEQERIYTELRAALGPPPASLADALWERTE